MPIEDWRQRAVVIAGCYYQVVDRDTLLRAICESSPSWHREVIESALDLALEIAREGREGRRIGTLFTIGDAERVLAHSRALILDPVADKDPAMRDIRDAGLRGTVKELAQLDGAFVLTEDGTVAACRYLDVPAGDLEMPLGMGSRHLAGAAISRELGVVAIVVSQSQIVRVFHEGRLLADYPVS